MSDPIWQLMPLNLGDTVQVVWRQWPDGTQESMFTTTTEYKAWLAEGNTPIPYTAP